MAELDQILDTFIPGNTSEGIPSASEIGFFEYLKQNSLQHVAFDLVEILDRVCMEDFRRSFIELDADERLQVLNACRTANLMVFTDFVTHLLRCYYTSPAVLKEVGAGSVPPFPSGNMMPEDDWTLLEPVYERGKCYRDV